MGDGKMSIYKEYIYTQNLYCYEKYEVFDLNDDDSYSTAKIGINNDKGVRFPESIYIKGINRIQNERVSSKFFLKDYLDLGKKLFELASSKNNISFATNRLLDDDDIKSKYIEENFIDFLDTPLSETQITLIDKISHLIHEVETPISYNDKSYNMFLNIIDIADVILNSIFIIVNKEIKYDVTDDLKKLSYILENLYSEINENKISLLSILTMVQYSLVTLLKKIDDILNNNKLNLRNTVARSISIRKDKNNITNIDVLKAYEKSPLTITFTYSQMKDVKKYLKDWLKIYGFPYYSDIDFVTDKMLKERNINYENGDIIPACNIIENSVFNYMFYEIIIMQQEADEKIKNLFFFKENYTQKNLSYAYELKELTNYYREKICMNVFEEKIGFYEKIIKDKEEYDASTNHFKNISEDGYDGKEFIFKNLCVAANMMLKEEIKNIPLNKKKKCGNCGNYFTPNKKFYKYCSEDCKKKGERKKKAINQQKNRNLKKGNISD